MKSRSIAELVEHVFYNPDSYKFFGQFAVHVDQILPMIHFTDKTVTMEELVNYLKVSPLYVSLDSHETGYWGRVLGNEYQTMYVLDDHYRCIALKMRKADDDYFASDGDMVFGQLEISAFFNEREALEKVLINTEKSIGNLIRLQQDALKQLGNLAEVKLHHDMA